MSQNRRSSRSFSSASDAAAAWLGSQELAQALRPHMAKARWAEVVGPQLAAVTQVEAVRDNILVVRVKNGVWANELTLLREDIVRRLNLSLGGRVIADIRFKGGGLRRGVGLSSEAASAAPTAAELARIRLPAEAQARIERTVQGITDDALRARLRASLLRVSQTEEWKRQKGWQPCSQCTALTPPPETVCPLCRVGIGRYQSF